MNQTHDGNLIGWGIVTVIMILFGTIFMNILLDNKPITKTTTFTSIQSISKEQFCLGTTYNIKTINHDTLHVAGNNYIKAITHNHKLHDKIKVVKITGSILDRKTIVTKYKYSK